MRRISFVEVIPGVLSQKIGPVSLNPARYRLGLSQFGLLLDPGRDDLGWEPAPNQFGLIFG